MPPEEAAHEGSISKIYPIFVKFSLWALEWHCTVGTLTDFKLKIWTHNQTSSGFAEQILGQNE